MTKEQCDSCHMLTKCYLSYKEVYNPDATIEPCPCFNCLVMPMCRKQSGCSLRVKYVALFYKNGFELSKIKR